MTMQVINLAAEPARAAGEVDPCPGTYGCHGAGRVYVEIADFSGLVACPACKRAGRVS